MEISGEAILKRIGCLKLLQINDKHCSLTGYHKWHDRLKSRNEKRKTPTCSAITARYLVTVISAFFSMVLIA